MAIGWTLVIQRLVTVSLFRFVRLLFVAVQRLYWELNGTARQIREANDPRNYERSAQVFDVLFEHHFCENGPHSWANMICSHNRFENPQFVIDNEHVTLFLIDGDRAVFGVAPDKNMQLWKSEYNSFIRVAQPVYCNQMIVVPLSVFHRMSETIGDPKAELVFIFNTARCGSTLLTQILEYTGRCVALSEPESPNLIASAYRANGDSPELRQLARDVIRWECRPYPSANPSILAYALKIAAPCAAALPLFVEMYPNSRFLFLYRDMVKTSKSLYRMAHVLPTTWMCFQLGRLSASLTAAMINQMNFNGTDFHYRLRSNLDLGMILNVVVLKTYLDMRRSSKVDVVALRYEDIVANPAESIRRILEYCRLPVELTVAARRGLDVDSQRNSPIAKSIIGNLPEPELTPEITRRWNESLKQLGLPLLGEDCLVEGTITCGDWNGKAA